mmetsp:Transcript_7092/g.12724  ORF Transcript_7092/g.12724 Transcript_7092/m.12724 type:complete len:88 (+) Transcript_7092:1499-1762(+)
MINMAAAKMTMEINGAVVVKIQLEREESGNRPRIRRDPASSAEGKDMSTGRVEMKLSIPTRMVECAFCDFNNISGIESLSSKAKAAT